MAIPAILCGRIGSCHGARRNRLGVAGCEKWPAASALKSDDDARICAATRVICVESDNVQDQSRPVHAAGPRRSGQGHLAHAS